eukprot:5397253-Pyramimonas_sp.AAC.1
MLIGLVLLNSMLNMVSRVALSGWYLLSQRASERIVSLRDCRSRGQAAWGYSSWVQLGHLFNTGVCARPARHMDPVPQLHSARDVYRRYVALVPRPHFQPHRLPA